MDQPSFTWYNTFDPMFNTLPSPSPTKYIPQLRNLIQILISKDVGWSLHSIHLFGWGQGGTMALELALSVGQGQGHGQGQESGQSNPSQMGMGSFINIDGEEVKRFGSVTSVCAGLLSHPTSELRLATPVLYFTRQNPQSAVAKKARSILERAFK